MADLIADNEPWHRATSRAAGQRSGHVRDYVHVSALAAAHVAAAWALEAGRPLERAYNPPTLR